MTVTHSGILGRQRNKRKMPPAMLETSEGMTQRLDCNATVYPDEAKLEWPTGHLCRGLWRTSTGPPIGNRRIGWVQGHRTFSR